MLSKSKAGWRLKGYVRCGDPLKRKIGRDLLSIYNSWNIGDSLRIHRNKEYVHKNDVEKFTSFTKYLLQKYKQTKYMVK